MFDRPFDLFSFRLVISAQVTGAALNHGIPALLKLEQSFPGESRTSQLFGITCMCVCVCVCVCVRAWVCIGDCNQSCNIQEMLLVFIVECVFCR